MDRLANTRTRDEARERCVFDPISILGSHLAEVVRATPPSWSAVKSCTRLLEHLRATVPALVKEVGSDALPFGALHRAFALLLRERAWPRDPVAVIEAMLEAANATIRASLPKPRAAKSFRISCAEEA